MTEQRLTLLHELVHRYLSPKTGPFLKIRAELKMAGYVRSAFLRYLEEALAEGYAHFESTVSARPSRPCGFPWMAATSLCLSWWRKANPSAAMGGFIFQVSIALGPLGDD